MDTQVALRQLGTLLAERGLVYDLVIIGGTALLIQGLIERATWDVDAVALVAQDDLVSARPLPAPLKQAVADIAAVSGFDHQWLNDGPESLLDLGLPPGFLSRTTTMTFGGLTLRLPSRLDHIHFKLYAAADQGSQSKHDQDLAALTPTRKELTQAAAWCRTHDVSDAFAANLAATVERHRGN